MRITFIQPKVGNRPGGLLPVLAYRRHARQAAGHQPVEAALQVLGLLPGVLQSGLERAQGLAEATDDLRPACRLAGQHALLRLAQGQRLA